MADLSATTNDQFCARWMNKINREDHGVLRKLTLTSANSANFCQVFSAAYYCIPAVLIFCLYGQYEDNVCVLCEEHSSLIPEKLCMNNDSEWCLTDDILVIFFCQEEVFINDLHHENKLLVDNMSMCWQGQHRMNTP